MVGLAFYFFMCLLSGMPFIFGLTLKLPINEIVNNGGGFIFFAFVCIFCLMVADLQPLKRITLKYLKKFHVA